jgi:hypothetical protein
MYDLGLHPGGLLTGMKMYSPGKLHSPVIGPAFTVKVGALVFLAQTYLWVRSSPVASRWY